MLLATTVCPFCKQSLLVDVALLGPVEDERLQYQLARAIAGLGPPAPDFSAAQKALADPRPVLARRISPLSAQRFLESLADFGLSGTIEIAGTVAPQRTPATHRMALGAALAVAGVAAAFLLVMGHNMPPVHGGASLRATSIQARAVPWSTPSPPLSLKDLSALAEPSTVEIRCGDRRSTGFFVARDVVLARFLTTVGCSPMKVVIAGGKTIEGVVTRQDSRLGLALIHVPGSSAEPLRLGDAASLHSGDRLVVLGAAGIHDAQLGIVAHLFHGVAHLPIEGDVRADEAGGPVLDGQGYVIGVVDSPEETAAEPSLLPINYTYDESHLLERPNPGPDLERWRALLAEIELTEKLRIRPPQTPGVPSPVPAPSTQ